MAKVGNPLMSITAAGTIGGLLTFVSAHGGTMAYRLKPAKGTGKPSQKAKYANGCASWRALTQGQKDAWAQTGKPLRLNGFQAFMQDFLMTPVGGTTWDSGSTTWDSGSTTWD